ncbi:MAG: hypothetical protein Q9227_006668 [Pyrenula ochraceoflavens]
MSASAPPSAEQPRAGLLDLEKELVCSICTEILYQPLTLLDCLHTFCGSCLKEWFSLQARVSSNHQTNPYTCPSCRASVRETRPNATVTTLLEMWLNANPDRARTDTEKQELQSKYRPGEDVVPKLRDLREDDPRREHRRRRRRHGEGGDNDREAEEEHERREIEEARERSLRDLRLSPPNADRRHRSRSSESRGSREERHIEHRREERRRHHARESGSAVVTGTSVSSAAVPTARQASEADARQRERQIEHQSSLRSLLSASDGGTGEMEEQILRQILDEGLLEGIDVDSLDGVQEEELSQRIADAYRRRHPSYRGPRQGTGRSPASGSVSRDRTPDRSDHSSRHAAHERRQHSRSGSTNSQDRARELSGTRENTSRHPPVARPHLLGQSGSLTPPAPTSSRQRRTSDQSRRQTSPNPPRVSRASSAETSRNPALRSATDLSSTRPSSSDAAQETRPRHSSDSRRATADSATGPSVSQLWRQAVASREDHRSQLQQQDPTESPQHLSPTLEHPPAIANSSTFPPAHHRHNHYRSYSNPAPASTATAPTPTSTPPIPLSSLTPAPSVHKEPSVTCANCQKAGIQHDLHLHCRGCDVSFCLRCYRQRRGQSFGSSVIPHYGEFAPRRPPSNTPSDQVHIVIARKWLPPPSQTIQPSPNSIPAGPVLTSSNPNTRLQTGLFCDRCTNHANSCFYSCGLCNSGEWGFCKSCVDTHHCCSHPLLAIAHTSAAPSTLSGPHPASPIPNTITLSLTSSCDICHLPIPPHIPWHHCPFHYLSSPPSSTFHGPGDYDLCPSCYNRLLKSRKIKPEDGPQGWHRCPGERDSPSTTDTPSNKKGHRMITISFEPFTDDLSRRVIHQDLVGGWALDYRKNRDSNNNDNTTAAAPSSSSNNNNTTTIPDKRAGQWSWRESDGSTLTKPSSPSPSPSSKQLPNTTAAPPPAASSSSSSSSLTCRALYSYFPDKEADPTASDELGFPKGAEIGVVEDINGDWFLGVYCGEVGLLPRVVVEVF